jgi:hypothetical protein
MAITPFLSIKSVFQPGLCSFVVLQDTFIGNFGPFTAKIPHKMPPPTAKNNTIFPKYVKRQILPIAGGKGGVR